MKIACISPSRDGTGYSHSANDLMLALDRVGLDVVNLWVTLSKRPIQQMPDQLKKLENKNLNNIDVVIQYLLPQNFVRIKDCINIGVFMYETSSFRGSNWQYSCNLMDEIWVGTPELVAACKESGVKVPVREIAFPHDTEKFKTKYNPLIPELKNRFIFYTISEISYRKNITGLLAAYFNAFSLKDNVALIIKGFMDGRTSKATEREFDKTVATLKEAIKKGAKHKFPPVLLITDWLSEQQIMMLHSLGNCFITLSRGEGECIPLFDAIATGNLCIAPNWNGPKKILEKHIKSVDTPTHALLPGIMKPVIGMQHTFPNLYLFNEQWFEPSICETSSTMRNFYKNRDVDISKPLMQIARSLQKEHSYKTVGQKLKTALEKLTKALQNEPCTIR